MLNPEVLIPKLIVANGKGKCACGFTTGAGTGDCKCGWAVGNGYPPKSN